MTITAGRNFRHPMLREMAAEHEAIGEARGEAHSILVVLESRRVPVPDVAREQILACTDPDQLDTWLRRAVDAATVEDVLGRE